MTRRHFPWITVSKSAIHANVGALRSRVPGTPLMAMVKANAYGHGEEVISSLHEAGVDAFGVARLDEGISIRRSGITRPVLVLGSPLESELHALLEHDLEVTIGSTEFVRTISELAEKKRMRAKVHIKIDTGMGRLGAAPRDTGSLCEEISAHRNIEVRGVYSHFSTADNEDIEYAQEQLRLFLDSAAICRKYFGQNLPRHIAASGGILSVPGSALEMVRPGILLYGISPVNPSKVEDGFRPALSLHSCVTFVKQVEQGASVGYGRTWRAPKRTTIATVPLGYGDGFSRQNSNCGAALVGGRRVSIVGRVSMDQLMLDCGDIPVSVGDQVTFIGTQGSESITVEERAQTIRTTPHEITTLLNGRLAREFIP